MNEILRNSIRRAKGQQPNNNVRYRLIRILLDQFAQDPSLLSHGEFVKGEIRNTLHSSIIDPRKHVTVRLQTADMIAGNKCQTVHVYSKNDEEKEYDGFKIFPERDEGRPGGTTGVKID